MKPTKEKSRIEKFVTEVEALKEKMFAENTTGYIFFAYEENDDKTQENIFSSNGRLTSIAECLYSCMQHNPTVANVIIAAANAVVQGRAIEAANMMDNKKPKAVS